MPALNEQQVNSWWAARRFRSLGRFPPRLRLSFAPERNGEHPTPLARCPCIIEGPAAGDVELNFRQRWNDVVERHVRDPQLLVPAQAPPPTRASKSLLQVARTIPPRTYRFGPKTGIQGIAQLYERALGNAHSLVYLENQYFWLRAYSGIDLPLLGALSPDMQRVVDGLGAALQRGVTVVLVLPDHPNVGRAFSDAALSRLRELAPSAVAQGRLQVFCLATSTNSEGGERYRPIYVHAKVAIVDDLWSTVGSANLNNRGMRDDAEMNVAVLDADHATHLRLLLWAEHLGLMEKDDQFIVTRHLRGQYQEPSIDQHAAELLQRVWEQLGNPLAGLQLMVDSARDNLRRYKARQPLVGHLLPYLTAEEARQQGLAFHEASGWIEAAG
jgi:phosphatidylserine/phosphatidylglycerophosphate/cardiolipin synthase-like enzyme